MIFEILIYFFLVFGIIQFAICIWELIATPKLCEKAFIVVKNAEETNLEMIMHRFSDYSLTVYAVSNSAIPSERNEILSRRYDNLILVSSDELAQIIHGENNGVNYRKC